MTPFVAMALVVVAASTPHTKGSTFRRWNLPCHAIGSVTAEALAANEKKPPKDRSCFKVTSTKLDNNGTYGFRMHVDTQRGKRIFYHILCLTTTETRCVLKRPSAVELTGKQSWSDLILLNPLQQLNTQYYEPTRMQYHIKPNR
eukprot:gb/GECG01009352.1/.p1 GENE.gb/GECG01009352.1/~~gb/GECG01009352.1/.p1  ORF type:complete len:144 (+),score=5.82 gb/GECG01009352.1/:1-432(+)